MKARVAALAALLAIGFAPADADAQLLDRIKKTAEAVTGAVDVAEDVGAAVVPVSTEQEVEIGRGIAATVAGRYQVLRDPELTAYVGMVGAAVAEVEPRPDIVYRFAVLDSDEVNAFAAPGGYVFVTRGALEIMDDEAMLAGVLAHEVGHVNERHVIDEIQRNARTKFGIQQGAQQVNLAGEALIEKAVEAGASTLFLGLSRDDELEADEIGVRTASTAGYDPTSYRRFLVALGEAPREKRSLLTKTHPDVDDRIERVDQTLRALPAARRGTVTAEERFAERGAAGEGPSEGR